MADNSINYDEIMMQLEKLGTQARRDANARNGADENQFGVKLGDLRSYAQNIKGSYSLAMRLWKSGNVDAMILATMIMDPEQISAAEATDMVEKLSYPVLIDELVYNVIGKIESKPDLYVEWIESKNEFVGRAGWDLIIYRILNRDYYDLDLKRLISKIEAEMKTAPKFKQESMNRCLVEIGTHYPAFTERCIAVGEKIGRLDNKPVPEGCTSSYAPEWIAGVLAKKKKN